MIYGVLFAVSGLILISIASTLMKYISIGDKSGKPPDVIKNLVLNHTTMSIVALVIVSIFSFPDIIPVVYYPIDRVLLLGMCVLGYIGIWAFLKGMEKGKAGIIMVVASLNVFIGYAINMYLFPEIEALSWIKIVLSIIFFGVVALFIFDKQGVSECTIEHCDIQALEKATWNKHLIYPIITAVCRAFFFGMTNYFIKSGKLTPYQSMFVGEFLVGVAALVVYTCTRKTDFSVFFSIPYKKLLPYIAIGVTNVLGATCMALAYSYIAGNTVNVMRLLQIPLVAVLSLIFLGDHMTSKQKMLIAVAVAILIMFVIV